MKPKLRKTAFTKGFKQAIKALTKQIQKIYLEDDIPWVIGYSGGKDSTATLQLIWNAISELSPEKRFKEIYVISTDTLVENPIVSKWVEYSLEAMVEEAQRQQLPIMPHRLIPKVQDIFWVNLIII